MVTRAVQLQNFHQRWFTEVHAETANKKEIIMENYRLEGKTFVIDDYDRLPAFSSFLPGLAGVKGIPMWTFYTNRGQGMNSFGIDNKGIDNL